MRMRVRLLCSVPLGGWDADVEDLDDLEGLAVDEVILECRAIVVKVAKCVENEGGWARRPVLIWRYIH